MEIGWTLEWKTYNGGRQNGRTCQRFISDRYLTAVGTLDFSLWFSPLSGEIPFIVCLVDVFILWFSPLLNIDSKVNNSVSVYN